ncbi:MAG: site-specific recombinase [Actinomycetota bacterium]
MQRLLDWLRRPRPGPAEGIRQALGRFRDPDADTLELLRGLTACLRPRRPTDEGELLGRLGIFLGGLDADPELRAAFRRHFIRFLASRRLVAFFADSGILPGTGFFSEWWRIIWHRLLPPVPDVRSLKDCTHVIFDRAGDWQWLALIPPELSAHFWQLVAPADELSGEEWLHIRAEVLEAVLILAHRISGLGVESALLRTSPEFDEYAPRFMALSAVALEFTRADDVQVSTVAGRQLLALVAQCLAALQAVRAHALTVGTSLHLTYTLTRAEQSLTRLSELVAMLAAPVEADNETATRAWAGFAHEAFVAENRRHSLARYWSQLSRLLALRVTENAARSGEHYICTNRADYRAMWFSAMGAGIIIGAMALAKIFAGKLDAPLFVQATLYSLNYGLGFVLIYLLGFTIATKQPAMTAQTLASQLSGLDPDRPADRERLVDLVAAVCRSQLAAIVGNVAVAFPTALALGLTLSSLSGAPIISTDKAARLVADLDPLGWALPHAAIAGFFLYLSGLISGYFDNRAACNNIGARLGRLPWLAALFGRERAAELGIHIQDRLGAIMGNFLFGCMLGTTGIIGIILGLPLDIRHITFAAANLGYALTGFQFEMPWQTLLWSALGVAGIGLTNLLVSFTLALNTALRARQVRVAPNSLALLRAIGHRLRTQPRLFVLPPRRDAAVG